MANTKRMDCVFIIGLQALLDSVFGFTVEQKIYPKQAITLLGKTVVEQCRYDKYI